MKQTKISVYKGSRKADVYLFILPKSLHWLGLMFKRRRNARALLFQFKKPVSLKIHSFFVFFPFLAVWIDEKGKILEKRKIIPFESGISPKEKFVKLIEIPFNFLYDEALEILDEN